LVRSEGGEQVSHFNNLLGQAKTLGAVRGHKIPFGPAYS
jgi:hypothetical protein